MRVALVVTGGVDESAREKIIPALVWLVERLARRHEVHVYALRYLNRPRTYPLLGATVHDLGRPEGLLRQYTALVSALRRTGPFDVLHAYWALPAGVVAALAGRRLRVPVVMTLDSGEFVQLPDITYGNQGRWRQRLAVRAATRLATRLTVCSTYQQRLAAQHGANADVIPWGIDTTLFTTVDRADGPPWRLLHVANLNPVKNQRLLLDAFKLVVDAGRTVHLDLVGQDTLNGAIQRHAHDLGLDRHVTFHGFLATDALIPLYQRAHLAIVTSRHEAAGVVALEAAACGVPAIGTPVGYLSDWSPDRSATIDPATAPALAGAIAQLLDQPERRARLAENARRWTLAHDADWTAAQFDRVYQDLGDGHRSRPPATAAS